MSDETETEPKSRDKRRLGRPKFWTEETMPPVKAEILDRLAHGESLVSILDEDGMPGYPEVMRWRRADSVFEKNFVEAREDQAEFFGDECLTIADSACDRDSAAAARVKIEVRRMRMAQLKARAFGEKPGLTINNNTMIVMSEEERMEYIERRKRLTSRHPELLKNSETMEHPAAE
jgi:hypothetical protein